MCGYETCEFPYICITSSSIISINPDHVTNFDNIFYAFINIFRVAAFCEWTDMMN